MAAPMGPPMPVHMTATPTQPVTAPAAFCSMSLEACW